jgi:WD40-like Beta Propeller Repeat
VASVLALVAGATAFIPLFVRHEEQSSLPPLFAGTTSVYAVPVDGGAARRVLRLHGQWGAQVVTADGRALLLERPTVSGNALWRVPLDGSRPTRIGPFGVLAEVGWSPDRRRYAGPLPDGGLGIMRLDRTVDRVLFKVRVNSGAGLASWNGGFVAYERQTRPPSTGWRVDLVVRRPDGRLVWTRRMPFPLGSAVVAADGRRVALVRMRGRLELVTRTHVRLLAADASTPVWSPDGRSLLYVTSKQRLVVQDVATGKRRVLMRGGVSAPTVSPDGRTVYVLGMKLAVSIPK